MQRALIRFFAVLSFTGMLACGETPQRAGPNVLLITVDTLRADFLSTYGDERSRTPTIDSLAKGGTVFENAAAPMPITLPSHFSMLTSRYPREHGVMNNRIQLPDSALTLAEILSANGYQTGGFTSVAILDRASGADQGFDAFGHPTNPRERPADQTITDALVWARELSPDAPYFMWVHLFEPHLPYEPPDDSGREIDPKLHDRFPSLNWVEFYNIARENRGNIPGEVLAYAKARYRGEIEHTDRRLAKLFDGLEDHGLLADTITVLTSDHGEPFENGVYFEHSDSLYDGAIRIPMIVNYPPVFAAGERVDAQVSIIDVAPTVLSAVGIEVPENYSGLALQQARSERDRYVLVQYPFYHPEQAAGRPQRRAVIKYVAGDPVEAPLIGTERVGIVGREFKLIKTGDADSVLYTRAKSHGKDELASDPETRERLDRMLTGVLDERPLEVIDPNMINDELLENLKALGYVE